MIQGPLSIALLLPDNGMRLPVLQLALSAVFLKLHPLPLLHTPSYENSVIFGGVSLGCLLGVRFQHHTIKLVALSETALLSTPFGLYRLARRLFVGESVSSSSHPIH